jgi:hypothetical protein
MCGARFFTFRPSVFGRLTKIEQFLDKIELVIVSPNVSRLKICLVRSEACQKIDVSIRTP